MTRHEIREQIFCMLFGADLHDEPPEKTFQNYIDVTLEEPLRKKEREELIRKACAIKGCWDELDEKINGVAEGWNTKRMGRAELNILRIALYEMLYDDGVPVKVAINEAVELSKEYGGDDAPSFVNGILAKLYGSLPTSQTASAEAAPAETVPAEAAPTA